MSRRLHWLLAAILGGLPILGFSAPAPAVQRALQVLILSQEQGYLPSIQMLTRGVSDVLMSGPTRPLIYVEYLDLARIRDHGLQREQLDWLERKFAGIRFDVIVALGPEVLAAVRDQLPQLVQDSPVVFYVPGSTVGAVRTNEIGVQSVLGTQDTLRLVRQLLPGTSRVVVIRGSSGADALTPESTYAPTDSAAPKIEFLTGESLSDLERHVSGYERGTVLLLTSMIRDRDGRMYTAPGVAASLLGHSRVPLFVTLNTTMGTGAIGGALIDYSEAGRALGKAARAVLDGKSKALTGTVLKLAPITVVDVQVMRRFGIPNSRVPPGAGRVNEPGLSPGYARALAIALAVVILQGATIVALLLVRRQRVRAQNALAARAVELRERIAELEESRREQRRLSGHLLGAQENERRRVARELHDDITQRLSLIGLQLSTAAVSHPDRSAVSEAAEKVGLLAADVSRLSHQLHPDLLHRIGLSAALRGLCRDSSDPGHLVVECLPTKGEGEPPQAVALAAYRVAQEALRNVRKHSEATHATFQLTFGGGGLELEIADTGHGFDVAAQAPRGLGLTSMRERAEILGGSLEITSTPGQGSKVRLQLPLSVKA